MRLTTKIISFLLTIVILVSCSTGNQNRANHNESKISIEQAEKIATEQWSSDVKKYNSENKEKINKEDVEIIAEETYYDNFTESWIVRFNFKDNVNPSALVSYIAEYSVNDNGEIVSTKFIDVNS
ncbi:hypothetical protein KO561_17985 [Radiobacillus kanasensis]|uniref:hypothetical protein n=1 Tax=Radiobacillus kanasensis TaxID=2844358 RepID=UPI001E5D8FA1|nr:hypothetical protein [Radiobacillus kanasensis]UFT99052.1 hypothetical protein KO561_17985 [Radiobacillus kanasensis]